MKRHEQHERCCKWLNEVMEWARQQVDPATNEGPFGFNTPRNGAPHKTRMLYLLKLLQDTGYVRRVKNTRPPVWWVKPDGLITPEDILQAQARVRKAMRG